MSSERETMEDVRADDASCPVVEAEASSSKKDIQYVDVGRKMEVGDIFAFQIGTRKSDDLEDWMFDFERQLRSREVRPEKWSSALKLKIEDHVLEPEEMTGTYEELRDRILERHGPEDPWHTIVQRFYKYQPRSVEPSKVINELTKLSSLAKRVATRTFKEPNERKLVLERIIPTMAAAKIDLGIPAPGRSLLPPPTTRGKPLTLDQFRVLLDWGRFPFNLDFPNLHVKQVQDVTARDSRASEQQQQHQAAATDATGTGNSGTNVGLLRRQANRHRSESRR